MTVIVFDGKTLASDGRRVAEYVNVWDDTPKFERVKRRTGHVLVASAGIDVWGAGFAKWAARGGKYPTYPTTADEPLSEAVLFDGKAWRTYFSDRKGSQATGSQWAIGCGSRYAVAALILGHDAIAACWAAIQLDQGCGGSIWAADAAELLERGHDAIKRVEYAPGRARASETRKGARKRPAKCVAPGILAAR